MFSGVCILPALLIEVVIPRLISNSHYEKSSHAGILL